MEWYYWAALAVATAMVIRYMRRSGKGFAAATNALLAEHFLARHLHIDPNFEPALVGAVHEVMRSGGFPGLSDKLVERFFNNSERFIQLNIIALAIERMGHLPPIEGEVWCSVRNPSVAVYDKRDVLAVADRLRWKSKVSLSIGEEQLKMRGLNIN